MSPLIDYSSSDSEPDENPKVASQHVTSASTPASSSAASSSLPPLPSTFHSLYPTAPRSSISDDPSLHAGRTRQIPHAEGTWPSHVQLEWHPDGQSLKLLTELVQLVEESHDVEIHSLLNSKLGAPLPLHISLSRTIPIQTDQRAGFLAELETKIRGTGVRAFKVRLDGGLEWASNEDGTRRFLVVKPSALEGSGRVELQKLLDACNEVVIRHGLAKGLYADKGGEIGGAFHFSIAWSLGPELEGVEREADHENGARKKRKRDAGSELEVKSRSLERAWSSPTGKAVKEIEIPFDKVLARVGNVVHAIHLIEHKSIQT
jgi:hypothetical protein